MGDLYCTYKVTTNKNLESGFKNYTVAMMMDEGWRGFYYKQLGLQNIRYVEMPSGPDNPGNIHVQNSQENHLIQQLKPYVHKLRILLATISTIDDMRSK